MEAHTHSSYQCTLCGVSFMQKIELSDHMLQHLENKKFLCSLCGKKFFTEKSLELHVKIHETELKYEALSTSSEEHMILSDQGINDIVNHQINARIPQIKVRVKSFPASTNVAGEQRFAAGQHSDVMHFQVNEEFGVIEESEVYTTQPETCEPIISEATPVQLKVWSKSQCHEQTMRSVGTNDVSQSPYIIKIQNKAVAEPRAFDTSILKNQEPIRIFVGSNIRIEDVGDFQQFTSPVPEFRNEEDLSQIGMCESVYSYETSEDNSHQAEYQHRLLMQEESEEDFNSLEEELVDGDLQSFQEEMDEEDTNFEPYQKDRNYERQAAKSEIPVNHKPNPNHVNNESTLVTQEVNHVLLPSHELISNNRISLREIREPFQQNIISSSSQFLNSDSLASLKIPEAANSDDNLKTLEEGNQQTTARSECEMQHRYEISPSGAKDTSLCSLDISPTKQVEERLSQPLSISVNLQEVNPKGESVSEDKKDSDMMMTQVMLSSDRPYKCSKCGLSFKFSFYLKAHLAVHVTTKYSCKYCKKAFSTLENHVRHMEPVSCSVCFKKHPNCQVGNICLKRQKSLKPFSCSQCPRKCRTNSQLKRHLKTHALHKCYICDKTFKERGKLSRHMDSHLNKKLYHCEGCNRTIYCLPSEVDRHKALHKKVVYCTICKMEYFNQHELITHMKKVHSHSNDLVRGSFVNAKVKNHETVSDTVNDQDIRSQVAAILIDELLSDMFEEELKEGTYKECHPLHWVKKVSDGISTQKLIESIGDCRKKPDIIRELSCYCKHDIIKDAVSNLMSQERLSLQKISQLMMACEQSLAAKFTRDKVASV